MHCYTMRARTKFNTWLEFTLGDLPVFFNSCEFALVGRPNAPILDIDSIQRGDEVSGLYEGDILKYDDCLWVVCYERGFYAINSAYTVRYLSDLEDYEVVGNCNTIPPPVPVTFKRKHLFKYKGNIFRLDDIVGAYNGHLLLRTIKEPVDPAEVQQECCLSYKNSRVFLGDIINNASVELVRGRVSITHDNITTDIATGGVIRWT